MTKKYYFLYGGILFIDLVRIFLVAVLVWVVVSNQNFGMKGLIVFVLTFVLGIVLLSKRLSYHLVLDSGGAIKEYGFFSKKRSVSILSIKSVNASRLHFLGAGFLKRNMLMLSFSGEFNFEKDFPNRSFPTYPVSSKILIRLLEINPNISVDPNLRDILPRKIRKQLGIKLNAVDIIGLWVWRTLLIILFLLLFFFAFLILAALYYYIVGLVK